MKTSLIVGCKGQDGSILFEYLTQLKYQIIGIDKNFIVSNYSKTYPVTDIEKKEQVKELINNVTPDEIYYLATYHNSSEDLLKNDYTLFERSYNINVLGLLNFIESIKECSIQSKLFYASSSLIFGNTETDIQNEQASYCPDTIYGITKLTAQLLCKYYRETHNVFASVGIMYNHESHLRTDNFLSKKIIKTALEIKNKQTDKLIVGDLNAKADWGYAPDYIEAMHKILQLKDPDEFIIATGIKHSVKDFVRKAFELLELDFSLYVSENKEILSRKKKKLCGDSTKLKNLTGWFPKTSFDEMVRKLINIEKENYA